MSTLSQFAGGIKPPKVLVGANGTIGTGDAFANYAGGTEANNVRDTLSGVLTAATYKDIVSVTGSGCVKFLGVHAQDATMRDMYIKLTIDGTQVVERTVLANTVLFAGAVAVGAIGAPNPGNGYVFENLYFNASMVIAVKSSLSETDKVSAVYNYHTS